MMISLTLSGTKNFGSRPARSESRKSVDEISSCVTGWIWTKPAGVEVEEDLLKLTASAREPDTARLDGESGTGELVGSTGTPGPEPEALG